MESPLGVRPSSSSESAMQIQTTTTTQQTSYTHGHSIPKGLGMNTEISQSALIAHHPHREVNSFSSEGASSAAEELKGLSWDCP